MQLIDEKWVPFLKSLQVRNFQASYCMQMQGFKVIFFLQPTIPMTEGFDVLSLLTDPATIAHWSNENLPNDRISVENATILTNAERWPLMIDPQLQGVKWIKTREGERLKVVRLGQKGYLDAIERAVANGDVLLLENIGESVDPVLDPLIGRLTIKKGRYRS